MQSLGDFRVGDTIRVHTKDPQDNKVHATPFEGVVIAMRGEKGARTFTVRKLSTASIAVERIFPIASPTIENIKVVKKTKARRAKLYYIRSKK